MPTLRALHPVALLAAALAVQTIHAEPTSLAFRPDGQALIANEMVQLRLSNMQGMDHGLMSWQYKPIGHEMIDLLYGQTDYVVGHVLGEIWDEVTQPAGNPGRPKLANLYVPIRWGVSDAGDVQLVQTATDQYRLTRTATLRRDMAMLEVRYELTNLNGPRVDCSLRLHGAMSPGARGRSQRKDHVLVMPTVEGLLTLRQNLSLEQYLDRYKADKYFLPVWDQEPPRSWVRGKLPTPALASPWTAMVHPEHGDAMAFLMEPASFIGYYNCPGITVEPVFHWFSLSPGESWSTTVYLSTFSGAAGGGVQNVTPLYAEVEALKRDDAGRLTGKLIPLFAGRLQVLDGDGKVVQEAEATADQVVTVGAAVGSSWSIAAVDRGGQKLGTVTDTGAWSLRPVSVQEGPAAPPAAQGRVTIPDSKAVESFLGKRDFTVYCDNAASDALKALARQAADRLGVGLAWTNVGGRLLVIGEPGSNAVVRDAGALRSSLSVAWPGEGKGAILAYDNFELTQQPILLVGGSDDAGAIAAAEALLAGPLKDIEAPRGWTLWPAPIDQRIYPYSRPGGKVEPKVRVEMAKGEYESVQIALTAYDPIRELSVDVAPLVDSAGKEIPKRFITPTRRRLGPLWLRWVDYYPVNPKDGWTGYADPLLERAPRDIPADHTLAMWLTIIIPESAAPGTYTTSVSVKVGEETRTVPIEVNVWDFALPREGLKGEPYMSLEYFPPDDRRDLNNRDVQALTWNLVEHGMRVMHLGPTDSIQWHISPEGKYKGVNVDFLEVSDDGCLAMDASRMDELVAIIDEAAQPFAIEYLVYGNMVLDWPEGYHDFKRALPKRYEGQPAREGVHAMGDYWAQEMITLFRRHLEKKGWLERFVLKVSDEPKGFGWWFDTLCPAAEAAGMPYMTAFNQLDYAEAKRGLKSHLKCWQPLYMLYNEEFFRMARDAGQQISWYNCGPPPRTTVHTPSSHFRTYIWQAAKADLDIVCWWGIQCWKSSSEVWESRYSHWNTVVYPTHPQKPPFLAKGWRDQAPIDSIRWEAIRDGMEDSRYVTLLRSRIAAARSKGQVAEADKAQAVLDRIWREHFPTLNDYKASFETILACRRQLAQAILELKE